MPSLRPPAKQPAGATPPADERDNDRITPARKQYLALKRRHPDALLLFRMGDFYEMFDDDAVTASRDLNITLTSREFGKGVRVPMAGIPHHALSSYLRRLLAKGRRVAISEQLSEAGHGLVERDVVRVLSPGTVAEPGLLQARENSYLLVLHPARDGVGLAYVDVSTGEFRATRFAPGEQNAVIAEIARLAPAECLLAEGCELDLTLPCPVNYCPPRWFTPDAARTRLLRHFGAVSLEPFGLEEMQAAAGAAAVALAYIEGTNPALLPAIRTLTSYTTSAFVALDVHTRRNLELTRAARSGDRAGSLLHVLDLTRTPMGGRTLRRWISLPLCDLDALRRRHDVVQALVEGATRREEVALALDGAGDLERLAGRTRQGTASARDLLGLAAGLRAAERVRAALAGQVALDPLAARLDPIVEVADLIERAVCDEGGRIVRQGHDAELDALVATAGSAQETLLRFERAERERSGIRSLKVGFNKVTGYYIEVSRANLAKTPTDYHRRQTLANAERFVTSELKEWEARILRAEEGIAERERAVFAGIVAQAGSAIDRLLHTAAALAEVDVLAAFAGVAVLRGWARPELDGSAVLHIEGGRHPVVEAALDDGAFIANDLAAGGEDGGRVLLITGPNMAGKSTYLRQTALIVLLAQSGSFVPAAHARIGLVDRVFTRVGAHDDLAAGASTFLVEMVETAAILRQATERSLLVFDEIGRGTSTFDGLAIARAVLEDVHDRLRARTLFATHFHELTEVAGRLSHARNLSMSVIEEDGRVIFLRRVIPGGADRSYGIHVAQLAGLPSHVTDRARVLLAELEAARARLVSPEATVDTAAPTVPEPRVDGAPPRLGEGLERRLSEPAEPHPPENLPARAVAETPTGYTVAGGTCSACTTTESTRLLESVRGLSLATTTPLHALNVLARLQEELARPAACRCGAVRPHLALVEPSAP